jgi:hypothetical protein
MGEPPEGLGSGEELVTSEVKQAMQGVEKIDAKTIQQTSAKVAAVAAAAAAERQESPEEVASVATKAKWLAAEQLGLQAVQKAACPLKERAKDLVDQLRHEKEKAKAEEDRLQAELDTAVANEDEQQVQAAETVLMVKNQQAQAVLASCQKDCDEPPLVVIATTPKAHLAVPGNYITASAKDKLEHCLPDINTHGLEHGLLMGITCCDAGGQGSREGCASGTYPEAVNHCASVGKQLCSLDQLKNGAGTGTGCGFDDKMIWSSGPCDPQASCSRPKPGGKVKEPCGIKTPENSCDMIKTSEQAFDAAIAKGLSKEEAAVKMGQEAAELGCMLGSATAVVVQKVQEMAKDKGLSPAAAKEAEKAAKASTVHGGEWPFNTGTASRAKDMYADTKMPHKCAGGARTPEEAKQQTMDGAKAEGMSIVSQVAAGEVAKLAKEESQSAEDASNTDGAKEARVKAVIEDRNKDGWVEKSGEQLAAETSQCEPCKKQPELKELFEPPTLPQALKAEAVAEEGCKRRSGVQGGETMPGEAVGHNGSKVVAGSSDNSSNATSSGPVSSS